MTKRIACGNRQPLDPRRVNIAADGNVFNRGLSEEDDRQLDRLQHIKDSGQINFVIAGGVRDEVLHPNTPASKKAAVMGEIFNLRPTRNADQEEKRRAVAAVLQGNAQPGRHAADASHLSEAVEYGACYFITRDERILKKRAEIYAVTPPTLQIVTVDEFLAIYDWYVLSA